MAKTVWALSKGEAYEGGQVLLSIFSNHKKAQAALKDLAKTMKERYELMKQHHDVWLAKNPGSDGPFLITEQWVEDGEYQIRNDYAIIEQFELIE